MFRYWHGSKNTSRKNTRKIEGEKKTENSVATSSLNENNESDDKTIVNGQNDSGVLKCEYSIPSKTFDMRCVETIEVINDTSEKKRLFPEAENEFVIKFNTGSPNNPYLADGKKKNHEKKFQTSSASAENTISTTATALASRGTPMDEMDEMDESWTIMRLRGPNQAITRLWVNEISHRVWTIAIIAALIKARKILTAKEKKENEEKEIELEKRKRNAIITKQLLEMSESRKLMVAAKTHRQPKDSVLRLSLLGGHGFQHLESSLELFLEIGFHSFTSLLKRDVATILQEEVKEYNDDDDDEEDENHDNEEGTEITSVGSLQYNKIDTSFIMSHSVFDIPLMNNNNDASEISDTRELQFCLVHATNEETEQNNQETKESKSSTENAESANSAVKSNNTNIFYNNDDDGKHLEVAYTCVDLDQLYKCTQDQVLSIKLPITHIMKGGMKKGTTHNGMDTFLHLKVELAPVLHDAVQIMAIDVEVNDLSLIYQKGTFIEIDEKGVLCKIQLLNGTVVEDINIMNLQRIIKTNDPNDPNNTNDTNDTNVTNDSNDSDSDDTNGTNETIAIDDNESSNNLKKRKEKNSCMNHDVVKISSQVLLNDICGSTTLTNQNMYTNQKSRGGSVFFNDEVDTSTIIIGTVLHIDSKTNNKNVIENTLVVDIEQINDTNYNEMDPNKHPPVYHTSPNDAITILSRTLIPKDEIGKQMFDKNRRQKTSWEKKIDTSNRGKHIVENQIVDIHCALIIVVIIVIVIVF